MNKFLELSEDFCSHFGSMRNMLNEMTETEAFTHPDYKEKTIKIEYFHYGDQTYYYVTDIKNQFFYIITWYKTGEMGCILFQGEIIDKGDFERFYKFLRKEYAKWILKSLPKEK